VKSGGGRDGPLSFHVVNRPLIPFKPLSLSSAGAGGQNNLLKSDFVYSANAAPAAAPYFESIFESHQAKRKIQNTW